MSRADLTRRVFLIGFMGAGKTTVGRALARRLGWNFFDLDDVIEQREGRSVATIFAHAGEAVFRRAESDALRWLLQERDTSNDLIVALGGGAFVQPENRAMIERAQGTTILLEAPLEELRRRCQTDEPAVFARWRSMKTNSRSSLRRGARLMRRRNAGFLQRAGRWNK